MPLMATNKLSLLGISRRLSTMACATDCTSLLGFLRNPAERPLGLVVVMEKGSVVKRGSRVILRGSRLEDVGRRESMSGARGDEGVIAMVVAEETAFLDQVRNRGRHHRLPGRVVVADLHQDIAGEDPQVVLVVEGDALDIAILRKVLVEALKTRRNLELLNGDELSRRRV